MDRKTSSQLLNVGGWPDSLSLPVQSEDNPINWYPLQERMLHHGVPGVAVTLVDKGEVTWSRAWGGGDSLRRTMLSSHSLFQAASVSKPVAALGAMRLVQEGLMHLHVPINRYVKRWQLPDNKLTRREPVTLARLLNHTAGTTVHGFAGYPRHADLPSCIDILKGSAPANSPPVVVDCLPGSAYRYSGGGYTLVQLAMEDMTGQDFASLMHETVLAPLGMTDSSFEQPLPQARQPRTVSGHLAGGEPVKQGYYLYPEQAAAGLWSTADDLARLAIAVLKSWKGEGERFLSPSLCETMFTPGHGSWGLGFRIEQVEEGDDKVIGFSHSGANHGFRSLLLMFRDGCGAAILTNSDNGGALIAEIRAALASAYDWPLYQPV